MKTCKDCIHWNQYDQLEYGSDGVEFRRGFCYFICRQPMICGIEEDDGCAIDTGPNFGCIHHQEKSPQ